METILIIAAVIGVAAFAFTVRGFDRAALQRSFAERVFQTAAGPVRGADLKVLRFRFGDKRGQVHFPCAPADSPVVMEDPQGGAQDARRRHPRQEPSVAIASVHPIAML